MVSEVGLKTNENKPQLGGTALQGTGCYRKHISVINRWTVSKFVVAAKQQHPADCDVGTGHASRTMSVWMNAARRDRLSGLFVGIVHRDRLSGLFASD